MRAVIQEVSMAPTKVKKEKILQDYGLHNIEARFKAIHCLHPTQVLLTWAY